VAVDRVAVDWEAVVEVLDALELGVSAAVLEPADTVVVTVLELPHAARPSVAAIRAAPTMRRGRIIAEFVQSALHPAAGMRPSALHGPRPRTT
jgi:hypothetical protein